MRRLYYSLLPLVCAVSQVLAQPDVGRTAQRLFEATAVRGGLVVHVGCGDGKLTAALRPDSGFLVHGIDTDPNDVAAARRHIRAEGAYGAISVDRFDGKNLPYVDSVVNLLVAEDLRGVTMTEINRVLAPLGVAYVKAAGEWTKTTKPRPDDIDEWTHYLHDASGNAVAHDKRVGPPRSLQWQAGPRWSRHHDHMASMSAMVSARGRVFYILDEGSRVSPQLPSDWKLLARDAFSGVLLWKRPIPRWFTHLWPLKSGPADLPRRLVAVGDTVYVTLGVDAPVTALDAASGKQRREYPNSTGAEELILEDGVLLVLVNRTPFDLEQDLADDPEEGKSRDRRTTYSPQMARIWAGVRSKRWSHGDRIVRAFEASSGRLLWERATRVLPLTLAADRQGIYFHNGESIVSLERTTGKPRWVSEPVPVWKGLEGRGLQSWFAPTLVALDGKVMFAGGEKMHMSYMGWGAKDIGQDTMTCLSAETGRKLWTAAHPYSGYNSPEDLFVINGEVWSGNTAKGGAGGRYMAHDLATGRQSKDFPPTVDAHWFHHRCYRAKATDRYILSSRTGIEFVDTTTGAWTINHWVRGGCLYGIMPCNGLIYSPLHPCACYPEAKLYGFTALAAASPSRAVPTTIPLEGRLERGPAYGSVSAPAKAGAGDWPTYRSDPARSGVTSSKVAPRLERSWETRLGGRLTQPTVGGGLLFTADVDRQTVHALSAETGVEQWSYTGGGRIDSSPTYHGGYLLFGSADGTVTALRARDGVLIWRFRVAPIDRRLVAYEQVESAWPVHGSVLVQAGVATVVAGRSMYLDGGLHLCRLEVATGKLLSEKILDDRDPETGENLQARIKGLNMPVALPDILSSDGEFLYMRSQAMDQMGNRRKFGPGRSGRDHLFAPYGFTDDSWFHRTYWMFADSFRGGVGGFGNGKLKPAGRILAAAESTVFGYGRKPSYYRWSSVIDYHLYAAAKTVAGASAGAPKRSRKKRKQSKIVYRWARDIPLVVKAMAVAGDTLLIAGVEDVFDEESTFQTIEDEAARKQIAAHEAALAGARGARLQAINAETGATLAEYRIASPPVFDGLSVAGGRVFIATMDGRVIAFVGARP